MKILRLTRIAILFLALILVSVSTLVTLVALNDSAKMDYTKIMVKFRQGIDPSVIAKVHRHNDGRVVNSFPQTGWQVVEVPAIQLKQKLEDYLDSPLVEFAEADSQVKLTAFPSDPPNDTYYTSDTSGPNQWGLFKIQADQAWKTTTGNASIRIAILDTGIDEHHEDLNGKVVASKNFSDSPTLDDIYDHGTNVAGIAAAITNNSIGVASVGCNSSLMNAKVFGDSGIASITDITAAIYWAVDPDGNPATNDGAQVINMSFIAPGYPYLIDALTDAVNYAWNHGVVVVAAAGNDHSMTPADPASIPNCIAVAATDRYDNLWASSNYGNWVDVAAPGEGIYSTVKQGGYNYKNGTSMAAPFVSGLAALLFNVVSDTNGNGRINDEVRYAIESTCNDIGIDGIGHGRINAYQAVNSSPPVDGLIADFAATNSNGLGLPIGNEPLPVFFYEKCISRDGITSWSWDFGDGGTSTEQNPTHIYTGDGTYTVTLTVTGADGNSNTKTKSGYITVGETRPMADFSATSTSGNEPLSVTFTNASTSYDGITSWSWDFGDGGTSTKQNPTHIYTSDGIYTVTLTVTEADGDSDTKTKSGYITVRDTGPTANFSVTANFENKPLSLAFTDASTSYDGITSWSWDFGDGGTSTEQNPTHIYTSDGIYTVTLTVTEADGDSNIKTKSGYITVGETGPMADFSATSTSGNKPLSLAFTDASTSYDGITSWSWDFGDGETSTKQNPTHIYTSDGIYTVTLTVTEADGDSDTKTKTGYITVRDTGPLANFSATSTSGNKPLPVTFTNSSTSYDGIISWSWDFGDGGTSAEQNPTHIYTSDGIYTVTLTVTEAGGDSNTKNKTGYITVGDPESLTGTDILAKQTVYPGNVATVETKDKKIVVEFLADSVGNEGEVIIRQEMVDSVPSVPSNFKAGGTCFSIELTCELNNGATITITVVYSKADVDAAGGDASLLTLSRYDEVTGEWVVLPTNVDTETQTLTTTTDHLSKWMVLVKPPSSSSALPIILGGILGGLALVAGAVFVYLTWRRRKNSVKFQYKIKYISYKDLNKFE